jgi:hypothetical protein
VSTLVPTLGPLIMPPAEVRLRAGAAVTATNVPLGTGVPPTLMLLIVTVVDISPLAKRFLGLMVRVAPFGRVPVPGANAVVKLELTSDGKLFPAISLTFLLMHRMLRNALKQKAIFMENQQFQCQVWFFAPVVVNCSDLSGIEYT